MTSRTPNVIVKHDRNVITYSQLWHASDCVLTVGIKNPIGSQWQFLSSVVLTAFALEAYLNHVGTATFSCWQEIDRLSPFAKLELLCEELKVTFPGRGQRPLQTIVKLLDFRNTIAHGRSCVLKPKPITRTIMNYEAELDQQPLTDWEKCVKTDTFAKQARQDVETVLKKLHAGRRDKKEPLFSFGLRISEATVVP